MNDKNKALIEIKTKPVRISNILLNEIKEMIELEFQKNGFSLSRTLAVNMILNNGLELYFKNKGVDRKEIHKAKV